MRAVALITLTLTLSINPSASAQDASTSVRVGGFLAFRDGVSGQAFVQAQDFAEGLPLHFRLGVGRSYVEAGSPEAARRVFINNATNGTPVEKGSTTDLALDALMPMGRSSHWGLAAGLEARYPMAARADLVLAGGGEYFFEARLTGHDTSYSRNGEDVNPREDYTYADADNAVAQPTVRPFLAMGVSYRLGAR